MLQVIRAWLKWHKNWDDLCNKCGKCCYIRFVDSDGVVIVNFDAPCDHLDTETHLCKIFPHRFEVCSYCRKVGLWVALTNPTLPNDCAYRQTFRPWEQKKKKDLPEDCR